MCIIFFRALLMLHVLIINPMVVTFTGQACRLIQVAMCAESSECKGLQHDYCGSICMLLVWVMIKALAAM